MQLTELVAAALKDNFEVRIAAERVLQARALYGITRSDQVPTVDGIAGVNAIRSSRNGANGALPRNIDSDVTYLEAGFSVGWELDVWGRLRRMSEAARAQYVRWRTSRSGTKRPLAGSRAPSDGTAAGPALERRSVRHAALGLAVMTEEGEGLTSAG